MQLNSSSEGRLQLETVTVQTVVFDMFRCRSHSDIPGPDNRTITALMAASLKKDKLREALRVIHTHSLPRRLVAKLTNVD